MITLLFCLLFGSSIGFALSAYYFRNVRKTIDAEKVHLISKAFDDNPDLCDEVREACYETLMLHREDIVRFLPLWCKLPYFQSLAWVNRMIQGMWPQIQSYAGKWIRNSLEGDKDKIGYIEKYLKQYKDRLKLDIVDVGKNPLRIFSVNVFDTPEEELMIAMQLSWASRFNLILSYPMKILGMAFSLKMQFSEMQFDSVLRFWGSPLVDEMPCVGKASLSLAEAPDLDFCLRLGINNHLSGDLMALPGLHALFKYFYGRVLHQLIVWPRSRVVELMENGGEAPPPVGVLTVKLVSATHVFHKDWVGLDLNDIYAVMNIHEKEKKTSSVKENDTSPIWNEKFTLLYTNLQTDKLTVKLCDYDKLLNDTQLCFATIPLNILTEEEPQDFLLQLYKYEARGEGQKHDAAEFLQESGVSRSNSGIKDISNPSSPTLESTQEPATASTQNATPKQKMEEPTQTRVSSNCCGSFCQDSDGIYRMKDEASTALQGATLRIQLVASRLRPTEMSSVLSFDDGNALSPTKSSLGRPTGSLGLLRVILLRADELESFRKIHENKMRPLAILQIENKTMISEMKKYTNSPNWNQTFDFDNVSPRSKLTVYLYHRWKRRLVDRIKSRHDISLGHVEIPIEDVARNGTLTNVFKLRSTRGGAVQLQLIWLPY